MKQRRRRRPITSTSKPSKLKALFSSRKSRKRLLIAGIFLGLLMLLLPLITYAYYARDINNPERLMNRNSTGITLLDKNGQVFYSYGRPAADDSMTLSTISDHLEKALVASEDENFYEHTGFSVKSMGRALYGNVLNRDATRYGGSTITQQLVKNNLLSSNKNLLRKYQELSLAIAIDRHYSKDEILQMYLNSVYFGEGAFGIGPAAKAYFNKAPADLTLAESSMLVGILPAPSAYSPISGDAELAKKQQERVLNRMVKTGAITNEEKVAALNEQLTYADPLASGATNQYAPHFAQMVVEELNERYGEERVARSGFRVTTSLDLEWQKQAEVQVANRVSQLSRQGATNAGLVAIDPKTGQIRALVGSADWNNTEFGKVNMALAERQPGSSFKPIYFAEALNKKIITPSTILNDSPRTFGSYKPVNYDFAYQGKMTARRALAQSRNLTAIEVMEKLGVSTAGKAANTMGLNIENPESHGLALALGTAETRLLDMTNAYAAYGNAGLQYKPVSILTIENKFEDTVYRNNSESKRVQSREASYLISSILADPQARAPGFSSLTVAGRPVAVKTGTTNDNKDAWTIGYTPSIAVGVWVGNNANRPMTGVAGGSGAGPVWKNSIVAMLQGTPTEQFEQPATIVKASVCDAQGIREDYFIKGTQPRTDCAAERRQEEERKKREEDEKKAEEERKKEEESQEDEQPVDPPTDNDGNGGENGNGNGTNTPTPLPPPPTTITPIRP